MRRLNNDAAILFTGVVIAIAIVFSTIDFIDEQIKQRKHESNSTKSACNDRP
jgi:hypothetical protein